MDLRRLQKFVFSGWLLYSSQHCWLWLLAEPLCHSQSCSCRHLLHMMAQACIAACPLAPQVDQMIAQEEATSTPGETANLQAGQTAANANPNLAG